MVLQVLQRTGKNSLTLTERLEWSETESTKYKVTHLGLTRIFLNKNEDTGR